MLLDALSGPDDLRGRSHAELDDLAEVGYRATEDAYGDSVPGTDERMASGVGDG